jgi:putative hydrolase of the HAD superfamily
MSQTSFTHVRHWIFDLDNTLYPPSARLFDQIERLMEGYLCRELGLTQTEAQALRARYWKDYGTTLNGLMQVNGVDPAPFLEEVHDINLSHLEPCRDLRSAISALPGQKYVYTNGSRGHAERVTEARGIADIFDAMFGIEDADHVPKPHLSAFNRVIAIAGIEADGAAMFEDEERNLEVPFELGMQTILVGPAVVRRHVLHQTEDLAGFLQRMS